MVASGASLPVIGALLGHRDANTRARYTHLATDPVKTAADQIGGLLTSHLDSIDKDDKVIRLNRKA